jgi:hypothetical protein
MRDTMLRRWIDAGTIPNLFMLSGSAPIAADRGAVELQQTPLQPSHVSPSHRVSSSDAAKTYYAAHPQTLACRSYGQHSHNHRGTESGLSLVSYSLG